MRLYHFLKEEHGLLAIRDQKIKVSRIASLNDPFEYVHLDTTGHVARTVLKDRKKRANRKFGLLCFSKNFDNPVQWAHYADAHRGLCLGFDVTSPDLLEVEYLESRSPPKDFGDALELPSKEFLRYMLSKKYAHWSYEQEFRMLVPLKSETAALIFEPFLPSLHLAEVIIGVRSTLSVLSVKSLTRHLQPRPLVSKVLASDNAFLMERSLWDRSRRAG